MLTSAFNDFNLSYLEIIHYLPISQYVSRVVKYNKSLSNVWQHFSCLLDKWTAKICKKFNSHWLLEGRPRQGKKLLPDWLDWLSYLAGSSKSHHEISISYIFLQSPHQVDMKNVVKWWKDFLLYFTTLETYREVL